MRAMQGRPVLLQRYPNGAGGPSFFQKRVPESRPDWLQTALVSTPNGTTSDALVAADLAHVIWAVNLGCIGFHVWPSHADDQEHADELRIDLDPSPGVTFAMLQEAAREVRRLFDEHGLSAMPKTTGNRGIHIYLRLQPRWTSYEVRSAAVAVARELERRRPELMTSAWWKEERGQRVSSSTTTRTRRTRRSSAPGRYAPDQARRCRRRSRWDELDRIRPDALTIVTVPQRLRAAGDPWAEMWRRSRSSRCWRCTSATPRRDSPTPPGRRCIRRCQASRHAWRPAGRKSRPAPRRQTDGKAASRRRIRRRRLKNLPTHRDRLRNSPEYEHELHAVALPPVITRRCRKTVTAMTVPSHAATSTTQPGRPAFLPISTQNAPMISATMATTRYGERSAGGAGIAAGPPASRGLSSDRSRRLRGGRSRWRADDTHHRARHGRHRGGCLRLRRSPSR